ncbi:MAG: helix-turn-helix domain-containing protein [Lachnospiraceae bacterium]|nr:helix-turn-helix domain-containing protein [Lachnospiraceae bacterium]
MKKTELNSIYNCPVEATVHLIGGKYKPVILWHLKDKILRFNELQKLVPAATPKMLTQQLRELERDNLILRTVYPVVPPKTEYSLTDLGKSIIPVLDAMCNWGNNYLATIGNITCCTKNQ